MVALMLGAVSIVIVHNHPSGDSTPSNDDINSTKRVKEAGNIIGIKLVDHVIVGCCRHYSMAESGTL